MDWGFLCVILVLIKDARLAALETEVVYLLSVNRDQCELQQCVCLHSVPQMCPEEDKLLWGLLPSLPSMSILEACFSGELHKKLK